MNISQCKLCNKQFNVNNVQFTVSTGQYLVISLVFTMKVHNVQNSVLSLNAQCTLYNVQQVVLSLECTVQSVHCVQYILECCPPHTSFLPMAALTPILLHLKPSYLRSYLSPRICDILSYIWESCLILNIFPPRLSCLADICMPWRAQHYCRISDSTYPSCPKRFFNGYGPLIPMQDCPCFQQQKITKGFPELL